MLLTARDLLPTLTNLSIEAVGEQLCVLDEFQTVSLATCLSNAFHDLILTLTLKVDAVEDIVLDAAREQDRLLLHECELFLVIPLVVQVFKVSAREEQLAIRWVIEAFDQSGDARFSTA